jgi:hypothetical protein
VSASGDDNDDSSFSASSSSSGGDDDGGYSYSLTSLRCDVDDRAQLRVPL